MGLYNTRSRCQDGIAVQNSESSANECTACFRNYIDDLICENEFSVPVKTAASGCMRVTKDCDVMLKYPCGYTYFQVGL